MVNSGLDGYEVEYPVASTRRGRRNDNSDSTDDEESGTLRGVRFAPGTARSTGGPVDLDDMFSVNAEDDVDDMSEDGSLFATKNDMDEYDEDPFRLVEKVNYFINPNAPGLLDNDASAIPGSPFSKPGNKRSTRPAEPLGLAKVASVIAFIVTAGWIAGLIFLATFNYNNIGRIVVEILLALIAFLGLFWNTYFVVSSICKCFIPGKFWLKESSVASWLSIPPCLTLCPVSKNSQGVYNQYQILQHHSRNQTRAHRMVRRDDSNSRVQGKFTRSPHADTQILHEGSRLLYAQNEGKVQYCRV